MDIAKNKRYFEATGKPLIQILLILAGIVVAFVVKKIPIGLGIAALGILLLVLYIKRIVTDQKYDAAIASEAEKITEDLALNKLGVDGDEVKEIAPITIQGYDIPNATLWKSGKDHRIRTNRYYKIIMFFSSDEVHCYDKRFVSTEANKTTETTDVYFYSDIVSVNTKTETKQITVQEGKKGERKNVDLSYTSFELRTSGGTSLSVSLPEGLDFQPSINAMRQLLREKKKK